jgi:hypothetical protein
VTRLTVGMAVYDDYNGVYFTIQSLRLLHAAELDDVEFLIIDNHPDGPDAEGLRSLAQRVPRCRYVPFGGFHSSAVRDMVFREAVTEYVLCLDAHVLLPEGTLRTLLDYFQAHPGSRDLVQGPMLQDSLSGMVATHLNDEWGAGMWGRWGTDPRGQDPQAEPFEIAMQGLGLFACRRDAWPGLNPRLRGHGGEEGCLHEKFRRAGARVICHPGVRWVHRTFRGGGPPYPAYWRDRARNYLLFFDELGWDSADLSKHLHELFDEVNPDKADSIIALARDELASPFAYFGAVFCLHRDAVRRRWRRSRRELGNLGIDWLAEPVITPGGDRARALRSIVAAARRRDLDRILILEDDLLPVPSSVPDLGCFVSGATWTAWTACLLDSPRALAVNHTIYDRHPV